MRFQALPGFRDFYPEEMARRRWIERAWHEASRAAGFQEIDGPVLESLELITAKSGDEIVDQLYVFADRGEREVALRPEMTPSLARMVAARAGGMRTLEDDGIQKILNGITTIEEVMRITAREAVTTD